MFLCRRCHDESKHPYAEQTSFTITRCEGCKLVRALCLDCHDMNCIPPRKPKPSMRKR